MDIVLWVLQILLAVLFLFHGRMMLNPPAQLPAAMGYIHDISPNLRRFTGIAEILAGIGLVFPWLTNILPVLTPLAGLGLVILMIGAIVLHLQRKEYPNIVFNLVLLTLSAFVAYSRWTQLPPM